MTPTSLRANHLGRSTLRGLLLGAAILAVSLPLLPSDAVAASLQVDDDGVECPKAGYTTLQAAVAAAAAGDTIKVCPGTYTGQVVIDKSVKIKGKAPKYKDCNTLGAPDPTLHAIFDAPPVAGLGGIGIDVLADNVTIQSLVITHAGETGIRTDPAYAGFQLKKAVFIENANGLYFHSSGLPDSSVKANCFRQSGLAGIRTRYGLADASIMKNLFFETANAAAIIVDQEPGSTTDRLEVISNKSQGDSTFAVILGTVDSVFAKNTVNGTVGTAIFVGGNNVNLEITKNTVTNAGTRAIRFNTEFFGGAASTGVLVASNVIDNAGIHGISVDSGAGESTLASSTIEKNTVTDSGQSGSGDGIRVEDPTAAGANGGNTIEKNVVSGSFNHDCHDDTTGLGTAGTGNTWASNTAGTQNVANLCFSGIANGSPHVVCGDNVVGPGEQCDEGVNNSDAPDATCRTDCRVQRCGDGILDTGAGEACEADGDCLVGEECFACGCETAGSLLGELPFSVIPGPAASAPVDDGQFSWLKVTSLVPGITNGSQGNFGPGPLLLEAGPVDGNGVAALILKQTAYVSVNAPAAGGGGKTCFRLEQDPSSLGFVDCDGGSNVDAALSANSHGASANDSPVLTIGGGGDSGPGAAVIRVLISGALSSDPNADCTTVSYLGAPLTTTALTTGTATSTILNPLQGGLSTTLTLSGQSFNCANWVENSGGSIVLPNTNMDVAVPLLGTFDISQTLRLNDD